ncbi:MAG: hypothetical protein ACSLEN_10525 [Candidatus Malihini olakiniferum]
MKQLLTVDSLPVVMIQKIFTFLSTRDYDNLKATNSTLRDALISINDMHDALSEKICSGALVAFYKTCAEAKHLAGPCPPTGLDRQQVDKTIRVYVSLLRLSSDVLSKCMTMKINNADKTSTKPQGITEKISCG